MPTLSSKKYSEKIIDMQKQNLIPQPLLAILKTIFELQHKPQEITALSLCDDEAHLQGKALLSRADFVTDFKAPTQRLKKILTLLIENKEEQYELNMIEGAKLLQEKLKAKNETKKLLTAFLNEDSDYFQTWEFNAALTLPLFLAYFSLQPFILDTYNQIEKAHDANKVWQHGHCPYCGSPVMLSYLANKEGIRHNVCSFCLAEYKAPRLQCPHCLESDNSKLSYFTADAEANYQVCVCQTCKSYTKIADFREYFDRLTIPLLDDLSSITLDIIANSQGYTKPSIVLW